MDIYDGRRAVPGDLVECIKDDAPDNVPPGPTIKIGDRFTVDALDSVNGMKGLIFIIIYEREKWKLSVCAEYFRIIPPDQKSDSRPIKFTIKENA